jgi:hypothetical protein
MKIALVAAIPLEIAAFKMLDMVPFDFDPVPALTPLQATAGTVAMVLHFRSCCCSNRL